MLQEISRRRVLRMAPASQARWTLWGVLLLMVFPGFAATCLAAPHTPKPGSAERKAILDALRRPTEKRAKRRIVFYNVSLRVQDGWAYIVAIAKDPPGKRLVFGDAATVALLRRTKGGWKVLRWGIATDTSETEAQRRAYPQAPGAIFDGG